MKPFCERLGVPLRVEWTDYGLQGHSPANREIIESNARRLGIPVTIVMPETTPLVKVQQTRGHGAEVVLTGQDFDTAYAHARRLEPVLRDARA